MDWLWVLVFQSLEEAGCQSFSNQFDLIYSLSKLVQRPDSTGSMEFRMSDYLAQIIYFIDIHFRPSCAIL